MKLRAAPPVWILLIGTLSTAANEPWVQWARNPLTIPVTLRASNILAATGGGVGITLADTSLAQAGLGCSNTTNASPHTVKLKLRCKYQLTVLGTNFTGMSMSFSWRDWTPLSHRGRRSQPKTYRLLINGNPSTNNVIYIPATNNCSAYSNSWTLELTERLPANWHVEDGSDDPRFAPGDGKWAEIGPGKSLDKGQAAIAWSVSLGRLMDGIAAGRLTVREAALTPEIYTPTNLYYTAGSAVVRDQVGLILKQPESPVLRQVRAYQTFVDILPLTNSTELRFYFPSQVGTSTNSLGHYTNFTGSPFVVWSLLNPEPATTNKLQIIEQRNGAKFTNEIIFDPNSSTATWTLKYGKGSEQRVETRGVTTTTTNRTETVDIRYAGASAPAYKAIETYHSFPWGFELIETRIDPDNNPGTSNDLVTTFTFNSDTNAIYSFAKPATATYPDGYWQKWVYDTEDPLAGTLQYVLSPDRDSPGDPASADLANSIVREFSYDWTGGISGGTTWYNRITDPPNAVKRRFRIDLGFRTLGDASGINTSYDGRTIPEEPTTAFGGPTVNGKVTVGTVVFAPSESFGFGYFGHEFYRFDGNGPEEAYCYHGGTYTNQSFTPSGNAVAQGPDWRQSVLFFGNQDASQASRLSISSIDEEPLRNSSGSTAYQLYPNRSWRENEIYKAGSLVQREKYVFTGTNGTGTPQFSLVAKWVYFNDSLGHPTNVTYIDGSNGLARVMYLADYRTTNGTDVVDGEFKLWDVDEQAVKTFYSYDSLKRLISIRKEGTQGGGGFDPQPDITTTIGYDAQGRIVGQTNSASGLSFFTSTSYDVARRPVGRTDTNALTTSIAYELGGRRIVKTLPSLATEIRENYLDRRLKSVTGTGVVNEFHDWELVDSDTRSAGQTSQLLHRVVTTHSIRYGTNVTTRLTKEGIDWAGRVIRRETADYIATNSVIEYHGYFSYQLQKEDSLYRNVRGASLPVNITYFDFDGTPKFQSVPIAPAQSYTWHDSSSEHRLTQTHWEFLPQSGAWLKATTNSIFRVNNSASPTFVSASHERLNGFSTGNILSEIRTWDGDTNLTTATIILDQSAKKATTVNVVPTSVLAATNIMVNGLLQSASTPTVPQPERYTYDALGRQTARINSPGFPSAVTYNSAGQVATTVDPTGLTTSIEYYANGSYGAGQPKSRTVNGKRISLSYTARGELYRTWGDVPYPEERVYSIYGELAELRTFRGGTGWNGLAWPVSPGSSNKTTWAYQEHSGLLISKADHNNQAVSFTYTNGLLRTRTWARGTTTTNLYNNLDELIAVNYSDSATTNVFYVSDLSSPKFNRDGRPSIVKDASGSWELSYDHAGRLTSYACTNGVFSGVAVSNRYNGIYGLDLVRVTGPPSPLETVYTFDTVGRVASLTNGSASVSYGYLSNSDLLQTTISRYNGSPIITASRTWNFGTQLKSIVNVAGSVAVTVRDFAYDAWNRRSRITLEDGSSWIQDYNDRNEIRRGRHFWQDWSPVPGQQFEYSYDSLGNRTETLSGGNAGGAALRLSSYIANDLNQYAQRGVPASADVMGVAYANSSVTINGSLADIRKGEFFQESVTIGNGSGPAWTGVTTISTNGSTSVTNSGYILTPPATQSFGYDADGNLTNDLVWDLTWDGENRLVKAESRSTVPTAARRRVEFTYDHQGRRATKRSYADEGSGYVLRQNLLFVHDGWRLLCELNATNKNIIRSYAWGQDLSGSLDGAGGIGGLVTVFDHTGGSAVAHFPAVDGNGNVAKLLMQDGSVSARYEYGPFGEPIRATGPLSRTNPFRFSTKFTDDESELVYYGHRYYSPSLGRWLNRDPIEEEGGINQYAFVANNPISAFDALGTDGTLAEEEAAIGMSEGLTAAGALVGAGFLYALRESISDWNAGQIFLAATATTDPNDDWEEDLQLLNVSFAGQLANMIPDPDDDNKKRGVRRSPAAGTNTGQIKQVDGIAKEVGLTPEQRKLLGRLVEKMSRHFKETMTKEAIRELAEGIKNGTITH